MRKYLLLFTTLVTLSINAQNMTNQSLKELLIKETDTLQGTSGRWQMTLKEIPMMVLTDSINDRMRIIAPITNVSALDKELLLDCLTANFHSALDVKYAVSDGIVWSVFIHPLSPLSDMEVKSAVRQVYAATITFGSTFSSTPLLFGGNNLEEAPEEKEKTTTIKLKKT